MSEKENNVVNFIDNLQTGNNADAGEAFKSALRDKVGAALDARRQEIAASLFNKDGTTEAVPHSDPKPEVADVGTFNQDGSVTTTADAKDGQADIDLTADQNDTESK
jgi:hypothetical protein